MLFKIFQIRMDESLTISADGAKGLSSDDLISKLSSDKKGLSLSDAKERLQKYGPNEITEKKVNPLLNGQRDS